MSTAPDDLPASRAAERAARESYGRLLAWLAYRWRDVAAAEDALAEAFEAALRRWPADGVPQSPEAWLMTVARRELLQRHRHARLENDPAVQALFDAEPVAPESPALPDDRLKLLFVCAHPALSPAVHAPLMLQTVLGLDAALIAEAFLVSPAAMAQRLVRAKARIRATGLRFEEPEPRELPERLAAVLEGLYGAFTLGSHTALRSDTAGLGDEALYLTQLVVEQLPGQPEPLGLLALMLYSRARRAAQFDAQGRFVPLTEQDASLWDRGLIQAAEDCLWRASRQAGGPLPAFGAPVRQTDPEGQTGASLQARQPGPFQLEAAIQSAHCRRAVTGHTPWPVIVHLYGRLVQQFPSTGASIAQAVAWAESGDLPAALAQLDGLDTDQVANHQSYWVARAHVLRRLGQGTEAERALQRAIGLTEDPRVRAYLASQA